MSELQTSDVPGLDLDRFRAWYDGQRPGEIEGDLQARVIAGGRSNLTYEVTDGTSWWIVRRPPLGHVQATAHDMGREYTAMTALAGTGVPVPRTFAHCPDDSVLGAPFYVMERVAGTAYRSKQQLEELGTERTTAIARRLVEVLAALHAVDPDQVGLGDFGRPQGFLERQVRRWGKQLEGSRTREHPDADELHRLLTDQVPAEDPSVLGIVHGDYRLDNVLVDGDQLRAVVDWEMATLGDTRTDLALMLVYDQLSASAGGAIISDVAQAAGWPSGDQQLATYAEASGRTPGDMAGEMSWHMGLAHFKLAVILEGIHYRFLKGQTVGEGFDRIGEGFDLIVGSGLDALKKG